MSAVEISTPIMDPNRGPLHELTCPSGGIGSDFGVLSVLFERKRARLSYSLLSLSVLIDVIRFV
jgi:hypothetical protein